MVQLYRVYKKWPSDEFKELTDEEQQDFYKKIKGVAGPKNLQKFVSAMLISRTTNREESRSEGGYYPLSWYSKNGFSSKLIKKKCKDTKHHSVFGKCYKVDIDIESRGTISDSIQEKQFKLDNTTKSAPKPKQGAAKEKVAKLPAEKKGPSVESIKNTAKKVLATISPLVVEIEAAISHPLVGASPPIKKLADEALAKLRPFEDACNTTVAAESPDPLVVTKEEIQKAAKDAQTCLKMLGGITSSAVATGEAE